MTRSATEISAVCPDPDCVDGQGRRSLAEPETDGDTTYHACTTCGYTFGWQQAQPYPGDNCAVGIPEAVRRAASPPQPGQAQPGPPQLPLLTIGRRRD